MTQWICRTWTEKWDGWTSTFDRFETEEEAVEHGKAAVKYKRDDVLAVDYEVFEATSGAVYVLNKDSFAIEYDAAVELMDDDLREELHRELSPCSEQDFFDAYADAHKKRFGEEWEPAKGNPVM